MKQINHTDEEAPFGLPWKTIYSLVILALALQILLFYLFTGYFS